jgi:hypothetical protein
MSISDITIFLLDHLTELVEKLNRPNVDINEISELCEDVANRIIDISEFLHHQLPPGN